MLTKAQMQALGRFAQNDPERYHVDTGWPNGTVRVYPLTLDGGTWRSTGGFHWTVDPEGVIRTPAGAIAKWDKRGLQQRVLVLWDHAAERPHGMTHRTDCSWAIPVSDQYRDPRDPVQWKTVEAERIPPSTGRCSRCGGGR